MEGSSIGIADIIVIALYLVFIVWWGIRHGKSKDAGAYFLAGRTMPWWVVGLSLFAASISSTTLIGQSSDAYHTGIAVFNYNLTGGVVVMVFFAVFLLPLYIKSGIFTIPEFLEKRYDRRSRYYFSAISILGNVFLDAAGAMYAAALIIKLMFPGADLGGGNMYLCITCRFIYHSGGPVFSHQCGTYTGCHPDSGLRDTDRGMLCIGRR